MPTRLSSIAPDLDAELAAADGALAKRAALAAAQHAADECMLSQVAPGLILVPAQLGAIDALVAKLDDECFSLQESEGSAVRSNLYILPFSRARAASAVAFALRGDAREAVYEAIISNNDIPGISRTVGNVLRQEA
jgi:hypothetical protein